jgi:hypothetical protein
VFLAAGLGIALWLGQNGPSEQHVHVILGDTAPKVTGVSLQYISSAGDTANETRFTFEPGKAPRIVNHDPKVPNGEYRLKVDVDSPENRRTVEKPVTLKGGAAQIDVSHE